MEIPAYGEDGKHLDWGGWRPLRSFFIEQAQLLGGAAWRRPREQVDLSILIGHQCGHGARRRSQDRRSWRRDGCWSRRWCAAARIGTTRRKPRPKARIQEALEAPTRPRSSIVFVI